MGLVCHRSKKGAFLRKNDSTTIAAIALRWRHNERDGVSNHRCLDGIFKPLFRPRSKKTSKLHVTGLCEGNPAATCEFPSQRARNAETSGDLWIPLTKDQKRGKCFHLMTSSWYNVFGFIAVDFICLHYFIVLKMDIYGNNFVYLHVCWFTCMCVHEHLSTYIGVYACMYVCTLTFSSSSSSIFFIFPPLSSSSVA